MHFSILVMECKPLLSIEFGRYNEYQVQTRSRLLSDPRFPCRRQGDGGHCTNRRDNFCHHKRLALFGRGDACTLDKACRVALCTPASSRYSPRLPMKSMTPQQKAKQSFEAQRKVEDLTEAETEELEVRKRRAEGTPVNKETFESWKEKFEAEMREQREREEEEAAGDGKKKKEKMTDKSDRISGFLQFSDKTGAFNLEAFEMAAENAQRDEDEEEDDLADDVDEALFDVDDEDLDDLDFDDDDDDDEDDLDDDDSEEEPDI